MDKKLEARVIALYLPQFHPIPENDEWWGKGFTEWTNVGRAKPLFKGHYQPKVPADLGYYDLRVPEVREEQAKLAIEAGVEGFCYYHYWFGGGKRLLERPFTEVVESGKPNFPFCLCWANHSWSSATWQKNGSTKGFLLQQTYPGIKDYEQHFNCLKKSFADPRYMKVDGKNLFFIFDPYDFTDSKTFFECWRKLAKENDLPDFYFVGMTSSTMSFKIGDNGSKEACLPDLNSARDVYNSILAMGYDAVNSYGKRRGEMKAKGRLISLINKFLTRYGFARPFNYDYSKTVSEYFMPEDVWDNVFPTVIPQWDRTARNSKKEGIYLNISPEKFYNHVKQALNLVKMKPDEKKIIVLKSWNEWAEGNYIEPDLKYGKGFIKALYKALTEKL